MSRATTALRPNSLTVLLLIYLVGVVAVLVAPRPMALLLSMLLPVSIAAVVVSVVYMSWVYHAMTPPRPVFFRMLLGSAVAKVAAGIMIGYLGVAALSDWLGWSTIPTPDPVTRAALVILSIMMALTPPVWYALTIAMGRRRAARSEFDTDHR